MAVDKVAFLILCLAIVIAGQVGIHPPSTNPDFPGHCWLEDLKKAVKGGEEWTDRDNCLKYSCSAQDFSYKIGGCGFLSAPTPCSINPGDKTKDYPDCCPKISCNSGAHKA